ncbi:MAG: hypothetical protein ACKV2Q_12210 [Planctomycetaceae bacterium]
MAPILENKAFDRGIDGAFQFFSREQAEALAKFQVDESLQQRLEELADKCSEGELSEDERSEYAGYVRANNFLSILQSKARRHLRELSE